VGSSDWADGTSNNARIPARFDLSLYLIAGLLVLAVVRAQAENAVHEAMSSV